MVLQRSAKFALGQVVRHRGQTARGVVLDADFHDVLAQTSLVGWTQAPALSQVPDQPFYRVLFEGYVAYMPEEELEADVAGPLSVQGLNLHFEAFHDGRYRPRGIVVH